MSGALRCLPLLALLLLGACQSPSPDATAVAPAAPVPAHAPLQARFETQLAGGELNEATASFHQLRRQQQTDPAKLEHYRGLLADAWLLRSQQALERGDLNTATAALARARALMPKAPALTNGLGGALQPREPAPVAP